MRRSVVAPLFPEADRPRLHAVRRGRLPPAARDRDAVGLHGRGRVRAVHLPGHRRVELWRDLAPAAAVRRSGRAASRRATCSAWRWGIRSTARTCSSRRPRSRRGCRGRWRWTRATFRGRQRARRGNARKGSRAGSAGLRMQERRHIPRAHYPVFVGDQRDRRDDERHVLAAACRRGSGSRTSGRATSAELGDEVEVDIRGRRGVATVVRPPFVDRDPPGDWPQTADAWAKSPIP